MKNARAEIGFHDIRRLFQKVRVSSECPNRWVRERPFFEFLRTSALWIFVSRFFPYSLCVVARLIQCVLFYFPGDGCFV